MGLSHLETLQKIKLLIQNIIGVQLWNLKILQK